MASIFKRKVLSKCFGPSRRIRGPVRAICGLDLDASPFYLNRPEKLPRDPIICFIWTQGWFGVTSRLITGCNLASIKFLLRNEIIFFKYFETRMMPIFLYWLLNLGNIYLVQTFEKIYTFAIFLVLDYYCSFCIWLLLLYILYLLSFWLTFAISPFLTVSKYG